VLVIDTSGSMGNRVELAKEVARLAIRRLLPHDKVGIVEFYGSKRWAAPLQPASNVIELTRALNRMQAGGVYSALEEGYYALLNARTRFKHILVLTDGGVESGPFETLARRVASSGINLSTVLIGPQANSPFLMNLAQWGRGRFYACPSRFQLSRRRP
jgi:Mg-chelatase subunit ChlD